MATWAVSLLGRTPLHTGTLDRLVLNPRLPQMVDGEFSSNYKRWRV